MKINQLETLILNQLGTQKPQSLTTGNAYPTSVSNQQPQLEVRDSRGQKQSVVANSNNRPAKPMQQSSNRSITLPPQNNTSVLNQQSAVETKTDSAVVDNSNKSAYALKIDSILKTLVPGRDFCQIPGVKNSVLLRSGLIKILRALDYKFNSKLVHKELKDGVLCYTIEITIVDADGVYVGSALGSSNSAEKKFSDKGLSSDNILSAIASTRALRSAVKDILIR